MDAVYLCGDEPLRVGLGYETCEGRGRQPVGLGALVHQRVVIAVPFQAGVQTWAILGSSRAASPAVSDCV